MNRVINLEILQNPWNWVSVGVMIAFVFVAYVVLYSHANVETPMETSKAKEA